MNHSKWKSLTRIQWLLIIKKKKKKQESGKNRKIFQLKICKKKSKIYSHICWNDLAAIFLQINEKFIHQDLSSDRAFITTRDTAVNTPMSYVFRFVYFAFRREKGQISTYIKCYLSCRFIRFHTRPEKRFFKIQKSLNDKEHL